MTEQPKQMLVVSDLYKSFKLPTEKASGVKQAIVNFFKGVKGFKKFEVLRGIDFVVEAGDFYGIVGRNGAGKSTLLKLISQIYVPDRGGVEVNGSLVPFIELGVGFNPELTGRENIYLNGALLGFSEQEVTEMYDEIVDFSELHEFMHQKLKNYSSGMQVRLAFSIAIKADADILVLDEILAVGDEAFQRKCNDYFKNLKENHKTVILVTHSMNAVVEYCNKAILIDNGKIVASGNPSDVANEYSLLNVKDNNAAAETGNFEQGLNETVPYMKMTAISEQSLSHSQSLEFEIEFEVTIAGEYNMTFSLFMEHIQGPVLNDWAMPQHFEVGRHKLHYTYPLEQIGNGLIQFKVSLLKDEKIVAYIPEEKAPTFLLKEELVNGRPIGQSVLRHGGVWAAQE